MTQGYSKALPLDTDTSLTANSDQLACSQKAVKTYIDNKAVDVVTHTATSKTTPVDADELPIVDSAASNVLKKLTWMNLKATLKTYFDTLYPSGDSSAWVSWTPSFTNFTLGNGSVTAKYKQIGKTVFWSMDVTLGTTSSFGAGTWISTYPVTPVTRPSWAILGSGTCSLVQTVLHAVWSSTSNLLLCNTGNSATNGIFVAGITSTITGIWGVGNGTKFSFSGQYEAA